MNPEANPPALVSLVRELLAEHLAGLEGPVRGDTPLELPSLTLISFAEALEQELDLIVAARDLVPENFATLDAIVAYAARRKAGA